MPNHRTTIVVVTVLLGVLAVGCGTPPWQENGTAASPTSSREQSAAPSTSSPTTAGPTPRPATAPNDLATGSAKRKLEAGGVRLSLTYWSTLPMGDWTSAAAKPLNVSASAKFIDGSKQDIFLSKVSVNIAVEGPDGALRAPVPLVDETTISPGYLIKSPSSYGQVFTIADLAPEATAVTLALTYELLAQTAPKAKTYAKQTASDTLVIPIQA